MTGHILNWSEIIVGNHKFSCKMRESIEIKRHITIHQERKPTIEIHILTTSWMT